VQTIWEDSCNKSLHSLKFTKLFTSISIFSLQNVENSQNEFCKKEEKQSRVNQKEMNVIVVAKID
jgi:hypothetical protein